FEFSTRSTSLSTLLLTPVEQRPGCREQVSCLEQRLETGQHHRPAAIEFRLSVLLQAVVDDREPTRIADRDDLPGHARKARGLYLVAPQGAMGLDEPAGRIDLQVFSFGDLDLRVVRAGGHGGEVARAGCPFRVNFNAEIVSCPQLRI